MKIGALTSLWLDKILLTIENVFPRLVNRLFTQAFHEFVVVLDQNLESALNPLLLQH